MNCEIKVVTKEFYFLVDVEDFIVLKVIPERSMPISVVVLL